MNAEFYQGTDSGCMTAFRITPCFSCFPVLPSERQPMKIIRFYADRSFLYLTGIGQEHTVLMAEKTEKRYRKHFTSSAGYAGRAVDREAVHTGGGPGRDPGPRRSHRAASGKTV
ncbi:MAG: hypothetical protein ACLR8P_09475 [Clostridium fessum]